MPLDGECIKEVFLLITNNETPPIPEIPLPTTRLKSCCGSCSFKVLGDDTDPDPIKNDVNGFLWWFGVSVSNAELTLMRFNHSIGDYEDVDSLNNSGFGTFYPFGFFQNDFQQKFIGYQINWGFVIAGHNEGSYKVRCDFTSLLGNGSVYSDEYCLHRYTPERAEGTVRIEYYLNGIMGINADDTLRRDYGTINWYNSLRLRGIFHYIKSQYENDYTLYTNGSRQWVKDEQEPEFGLLLKPMCWNFHELMRTDVLQADDILITDYNSNNFAQWFQKSVQKTSEYPPNFFLNQSKLASVTLTFRQKINNLKKRRF